MGIPLLDLQNEFEAGVLWAESSYLPSRHLVTAASESGRGISAPQTADGFPPACSGEPAASHRPGRPTGAGRGGRRPG